MSATDRALDLLTDLGAVARLTQLVTRDGLTGGLRERVQVAGLRQQPVRGQVWQRRYGTDVAASGGPLAYAVHCSACTSVWVALAVLGARHAAPVASRPILRALALSHAVGLLADRT